MITEIIAETKVILQMPQEIKCWACGMKSSIYDGKPMLDIDSDSIEKQIDAITMKYPNCDRDCVKIIILIDQQGDRIFGHPVEYRVKLPQPLNFSY